MGTFVPHSVKNLQTIEPNPFSNIKKLHSDQALDDIWQLFYPSRPNRVVISGKNVEVMSNETNCFLYNCIFIDITTKSAIYYTNDRNMFLSAYCSFNNCSSDTNGGSIYFNCNSDIAQYRTCAYKSKTNSDHGHHSYVCQTANVFLKNYLYESSFYECGNLEKSSTNYLWYASILVKSTNTSFCEAKTGSGIYLNDPKLNEVTYSSFCNTTADSAIIMVYKNLFDEAKYINFMFCNVLNNAQKNPYSGGTFISDHASITIQNCSFLENTGPRFEFRSNWYPLTIIDSFCDRIDKTKGDFITNNFQNISSIQELSNFLSYICEFNVQTKPHSDAFYPSFNLRRVR